MLARQHEENSMDRLPFDHYYDFFEPKLDDIPIHNDFLKFLDWVADKPGVVLAPSDIASILTDGEKPGQEAIKRAIGVATIMASWQVQLAHPFYRVKDASGTFHEVEMVDTDTMDGKKPYVIEATGEVIEDFPSNAYACFRVVDFEPRPAPVAAASAGLRP
jgi:hypothetical protein